MLQLYFIIGIIIFTWTGSRLVLKNKDYIKQPLFWVSTALCVIIWPVIIAWVIYDLIRMFVGLNGEES